MISSKENDMKEEIYQGYQQLAFGSIADAIKLLFMEEPAPRALGKMNFINVAEIRRMKEGAMEIKFFDRLKALASLYEYSGDADSKAAAQTLLAALSGGEAVDGDGV